MGSATWIVILLVVAVVTFDDVECQCSTARSQTTKELSEMLFKAGGTLNPQLVAINKTGARNFRSHYTGLTKSPTNITTDGKRTRKRRSVIGTCYDPLIAVNGWHVLCKMCESETQLSSDYFPQYVNELICTAGYNCFQGEGSCSNVIMGTIFLKKTGQCVTNGAGILMEEWAPVTFGVKVACQCKLSGDSSLIDLL